MALPKIGLEAVLEDKNFRKGLKNYIDGIDKMEKGNEEMSEAAKKSGKSLDGLSDDMKKGGKSALDLAAQLVVVKMAMNTIKEIAGKGLELAKLGATAERVEERFGKFAEEAGGATEILAAFQEGAGHAASSMDAMLSSSKLLQMGLVTNADEMETVVEMATRLGDQTAGVTSRVEDFALMLANQSIPRLDNFGISSGQVRARITELMGSVEGMTRETAFMQATMEAGGESLAILGERTEDTAMTFEIMEARMADAKVEMGKKFAPVAGAVFEILGGLGDEVLMVGAAFGEFGGALVQAGPLLNAMMPALKGLMPAIGKLPAALKAMNLGLNASTLAMGGILALVPLIIIGVGKLKDALDDYAEAVDEAVRVQRKWGSLIEKQVTQGRPLENIIRERTNAINEQREALKKRSDLEIWWQDKVLLGTQKRNREVMISAHELTEAIHLQGFSAEQANVYIRLWNEGLGEGVGTLSEFTDETLILARNALPETQQAAEDADRALLNYLYGMETGIITSYSAAAAAQWLGDAIEDAGEGAEDSESRFRHLHQALEEGIIITDDDAAAQANLVYELGLQAQALEDSKSAAEEAARVQEELALAQERAIDATIRQQQEYLTLAERMMGLDDKGFARQVLGLINELQDDHIPIGEQYDAAFRSTQDEFGLTDKKGRFLAEGFSIIEAAARRGGLGELTLIEATDLLRDAWKRGETDSLAWAEKLGLAPPLTDAAATSAELFGTKLDGMKIPLGAVTTGVGYLGDAADKLKKPADDAKDAIFDFTRKNIEAEEPIQRTEHATRLLQKELRDTLDPTDAMTGAVELYGEAGDASEGPIKILTDKTKDLMTAAGQTVGPLEDEAEAIDGVAESALDAQDPVDELLARFELLPDQILTLAPQMRQAGESLVGAFRVGFEAAFEALEEEKVKRLQEFREEFHASREPKDPTSPLRGFFEAGAALVQTYMEGLESEWPNLGRTLDDMFTFGRAFGGLGGIAAGILNKDVRAMKEATKGIDAELTKIFKSLGVKGRPKGGEETYQAIIAAMGGQSGYLRLVGAEVRGEQLTKDQARRLAIFKSLMPLMRERGELTREQIRLEEKLAAMEEQQTRLRFLEQQVALLELIEKHGLMGEDILDGMRFGADASAEEVLEAMTRAMEEVIKQAEERLGIESPSKVFFKIGQQTMAGMAMGIQDLATLPVRQSLIASGAVASAPAMTGGGYVDNSRTVTIQAGGNTITNAAEGAHFESRVKRAVVKGMRGV